jgi:hypothetical protein
MKPHQYVILRDKMTGGSLLSQFGHAVGESVTPDLCPLSKETIIHILIATKARMEAACADLRLAGTPLAEVYENTGPMAGSRTAVGFIVMNPELLPQSVKILRAATFDRVSRDPAEPEPSIPS